MTKLEELINLYGRGVGHTRATIAGVKSDPSAVLIVAKEAYRNHLDLPKHQIVSINQIPDFLVGRNCPILIDNNALDILVRDCINHYTKKSFETKLELAKVKEQLHRIINDIVN